eukprot:gene4948-5747_t
MTTVKGEQLKKTFIGNAGELFKYMDSLSVPIQQRSSSSTKLEKESSSSSLTASNTPTLSKSKASSFMKADSFKAAKDKSNVATNVFCLFQDQMSPCLLAINHFRTTMGMSMADIFRERLAKTHALLTDTKIQHYLSLLHYYLRMIDLVYIEKQKVLIDMSQQLVGYLSNYSMDPDNCVVGLIPSDDLLNKLARDYEFLRMAEPKNGQTLGEASIDETSTFLNTTISTTREQLLVNIINWSALSDAAQISKSVRRYASILRGVDKLKRGDIVVVRLGDYMASKSKKATIIGFKSGTATSTSNNSVTSTSPSTSTDSGCSSSGGSVGRSKTTSITLAEYMEKRSYQPKAQFARYTGDRGDFTITVYFSSEEIESVVVGIEDVLPLNRSTAEALRDLSSIEKMIFQPTSKFFSQILEESKQQTINYMMSLGVDINFVTKNAHTVTIFDLERLKPMQAILSQLDSNTDHVFYVELERQMSERIDAHIAALDSRLLFTPKYESTMTDLRGTHHMSLARNKVKQLLWDCHMMLDQLKIEKRKLMNGTFKEEITEWWLKRVDTRVADFLTERGYNFAAIPENYIEQPPLCMKDVISNLVLVQKILDPAEHVIEIITLPSTVEDGANVIEEVPKASSELSTSSSRFLNSPVTLIKELREEIYPEIHKFIRKAHIVLSEHFGLAIDQFTVERANEMLAKSRTEENADAQVIGWIEDMLSDLVYLKEMERLEDAKNEKSMHIVPIGGLVMGSFARLENELNTVVELWDSPEDETGSSDDSESEVLTLKVTQKTPPLNEKKSLLHSAVATEQLHRVKEILETDSHTINDADVNGWTPLHSAAYAGNADVCKELLKTNGIDVCVKNRDGASVLHYLVRHPLTERRKKVILKLVKKGLDINNGSRHGETSLHSASFKGVNDVVQFLILNGANPNSITQGGETPLHYAVTAARANVVTTLLLNGAQFNICSKRGTPMDIARNAKLTNIISILENGPELDNFAWRKNNKQALQQALLVDDSSASSSSSSTPTQTTSSPSIASQQQQQPHFKRICKIEIGGSRGSGGGTIRSAKTSPTSSSSPTTSSFQQSSSTKQQQEADP